MQLIFDLLSILAPWEAWLFALAAAATVAIGAIADKRPLTGPRLREGILTSIVFMMLGVRGVVFAITAVVFPELIVGTGAFAGDALIVAGICAGAGLLGIVCHKASAPWRLIGAIGLFASAIAETVYRPEGLGLALSVAIDLPPIYIGAVTALIVALASWNSRIASPNPLRHDPRPFDY